MVIGSRINIMAQVFILPKMVINMKANFKMEKNMAKEKFNTIVEILLKVIGIRINLMAKVFFFSKMEINTKAIL